MLLSWLKFVVCTTIIFFSGKRVAKYGDIITEKTGLSGLWIGLTLVAICTSLPEIFTGIGSIIFVDAPDLTVGNLFGANTYNLLNIALLDFLHKGIPLLSSVSVGQLLIAGLSLIPLLIAIGGIFLSTKISSFGIFHISIYSILILVAYLVSTRIIFKFEKANIEFLRELQEEQEIVFKYKEFSLKKAFLFYGISAATIVVSGIWLSYIGEELSGGLGWERNFVGSLFLGFATTLPELTVSAAALYLGAKELAVANMLGSNLFNMTIIFINDLLYLKAPIFEVLSLNHILTGFVVVLMTFVVISGLVLKPKNKTKLGLSNYALVLIAVFILGAYINFILGAK